MAEVSREDMHKTEGYDGVFDEISNAETLDKAIGMAIGAGSACWESIDRAGEFQSEVASAVCDALKERVEQELDDAKTARISQLNELADALEADATDGGHWDGMNEAADRIRRFAGEA